MEKNLPKISFIIPVFNSEDYLEECVNSIISQNYNNFEIILIDDGSSDRSSLICDNFADNHKNITAVHKINEGVAIARNMGIQMSSGEYLFFIDNDDFLAKDAVKNIQTSIAKDVDVIFNHYLMIKDNKEFNFNKINKDFLLKFGNNSDVVLNYILKKRINIMAPWEYLVKRDLLIKNKIEFDKNQNGVDDSVFSPLVFCSAKSFFVASGPVYCWRNRLNSQSKSHDRVTYIKKMISTIDKLKANVQFFEGVSKLYLYFSIHKNIFSLIGIYYSCSKLEQKLILDWYRKNKSLIWLSIKKSSIPHLILCDLFGLFNGLVLSYKLANLKGFFYEYFRRIKTK